MVCDAYHGGLELGHVSIVHHGLRLTFLHFQLVDERLENTMTQRMMQKQPTVLQAMSSILF